MSGRRARRAAARARREEWDAGRNPPCPDVEEVEIDAVTHCITVGNLLDVLTEQEKP